MTLGGHRAPDVRRAPRDDDDARSGVPWGRAAWFVAGLGAALAIAGASTGSVWGFGAGAWIVLTAVSTSRLRLAVAGAASALLVLAPVVVALRAGSSVGVRPAVLAGSLWLLVLVAASVVLVVRRRLDVRPSPVSLHRACWLLVPVLVGVGSVIAVLTVPGGAVRAWSFFRDSATNLLFVRFIVEDGGVDPSVHPNPAYLLQGLVALDADRGATVGELYAHYQATWAAAIIASAVVLACIPLAVVVRRSRAVTASLLTTAFAYSWFVTGFATSFGFANVSVTLVVLGCCVLVSAGQRSAPALRTAVLAVGAVLVAATWAPLVVVPAALGIRVLTSSSRRDVFGRGPILRGQSGLLVLAAAGALAYAALVVLPDLRTDGANLAQDGWFFAWGPVTPGVVAVGVLVCAVTGLAGRRRPRDLVLLDGAVIVVAVGVVVVVFVVSSVAADLWPWTYYPKKLSWIGVVLAVVVLVTVAAGAERSRSVLAPVAVLVAVSASIVPHPDGPGLRGYMPVHRILAGIDVGVEARAVRVLSWLDDPRPHLVWLDGSTADDDLANLWLTTLQADSPEDPLRSYASTLEHDPAQVCDALSRLGDRAVLVTRAQNAAAAVSATCPEISFTTELVPAS